MRHIRVRNATAVEAEISAKSYKRLCAKLKGYNRKILWGILDHFIFHIMEDHHVEELLKILDHFEQTNSLEDIENLPNSKPDPKPVAAAAEDADIEEVDAPTLATGYRYDTPITQEDMERSKNQMDLLYDVTYFTYLTREAAQGNAQKLLTFADANSIPAPAHWHLIAQSADFLGE